MKAHNADAKVEYLDINRIRPNPYQPRKKFDNIALEELASSIKSYGVLQPINVRRTGDDYFELVAGERRLKASKMIGLGIIPAIVMNIMEQDSAVLALIENLQREDLNFFEEAEGYHYIMKDYGLTQEQLAAKVGKNQSTIANKLRLLRLSKATRRLILENGLTERHSRALLKIPDEKMRMDIIKRVADKSLTVKETEQLIENVIEKITGDQSEGIDIQKEINRNIKGAINYRIYVNTIKNAYRAIKQSGVNAQFEERDTGEFIEVVIKISK